MVTKKQINDFLSDPDYLALIDMAQENRLLFITEMTETRLSSVLAWLFRPYEGHGLGDKAIRQLLLTAWQNNNLSESQLKIPTPTLISSMSFRDLVVFSEYHSSDGRIDLLLVSRQNKLVLVIENKFGSKEQNDQLARYKKYIDRQFALYTHRVHIYLDRYWDKDNQVSPHSDWIACDYEWFLELIKTQLKAGLLSPKALDPLMQVSEYLNPDSEEMNHKEQEKAVLMRRIAANHVEVLSEIRSLKNESPSKNHVEAVSIDLTDPLRVEQQQRQSLWDEVLSQAHHAKLMEDMQAKFGDALEADIYPSEVFFRLKQWARFDKPDSYYWGPRVHAYKGRDKPESKIGYDVTAAIRFNDMRDEAEINLRNIVPILRDKSMKAAPKSAKKVELSRTNNVPSKSVVDMLEKHIKAMDVAFKNIN